MGGCRNARAKRGDHGRRDENSASVIVPAFGLLPRRMLALRPGFLGQAGLLFLVDKLEGGGARRYPSAGQDGLIRGSIRGSDERP
jgi:hypothetical protein